MSANRRLLASPRPGRKTACAGRRGLRGGRGGGGPPPPPGPPRGPAGGGGRAAPRPPVRHFGPTRGRGGVGDGPPPPLVDYQPGPPCVIPRERGVRGRDWIAAVGGGPEAGRARTPPPSPRQRPRRAPPPRGRSLA